MGLGLFELIDNAIKEGNDTINAFDIISETGYIKGDKINKAKKLSKADIGKLKTLALVYNTHVYHTSLGDIEVIELCSNCQVVYSARHRRYFIFTHEILDIFDFDERGGDLRVVTNRFIVHLNKSFTICKPLNNKRGLWKCSR